MKINLYRLSILFLLVLASLTGASAQENLPELVRTVKPSAVAVETFGAKGEKLSRGSGFFVAADKIITNRHVIENANRVEIKLMNGKTYQSSGVLAIDGEADLALLQVVVPIEFAVPLAIEKKVPQEGESIVVIGNPFGLEGSVSNGIVSAVRDIAGYGKIIQITAPISPGSSGSPVVNMNGQVVGIATLQAAEGQSLNFAIPATRISSLKINNLQSFANLDTDSRKNKRASAERFYVQGLGLMSRDDYAKAAQTFERAVQIDPDYAEAWYQTGFAYGMLGKHAEALKASRQAARVRPDWAEAHINIGASSFALTQFKEAAEAYRAAAKIDAYNPETQFALGLTLGKLSKPEEEMLAYKRAVALKSDFVAAWEKLGVGYFKVKRWTDAQNAFEQYKILKGDAKSYNYIGETLFEQEKFGESVESFNTALAMNPDFHKARYNLARAYLKQDNQASALAQYEYFKNVDQEWADKLYVLIYP